jgi:4-carboxymuconolactone decarboxylase
MPETYETVRSSTMTSNAPQAVDGDTRYAVGLGIRKKVLGDDHVQRSLANVNEFTAPIQELVTEYCWGAIWSRPGLEPRERSLLNIAMLTVLHRNHELSAHVKGAVRNGASRTEIREVLMQTAIYAGVPAALESFRVADDALQELDAEPDVEA